MLKANDTSTYKTGVEILQSEAAEDGRAKLKHGTERWTRQSSQKAAENLYGQVAEIEGYLSSASSSDELVKAKVRDCEDCIKILEGTDRDLESYIPSSRRVQLPPQVEEEAGNLRTILSHVNRLESGRRRKTEVLRAKAKADDISELFNNNSIRYLIC